MYATRYYKNKMLFENKNKIMVANCVICNKKLKVIEIGCKCKQNLCSSHRVPEKHDCTYDHKGEYKKFLEKSIVHVQADRMKQRI